MAPFSLSVLPPTDADSPSAAVPSPSTQNAQGTDLSGSAYLLSAGLGEWQSSHFYVLSAAGEETNACIVPTISCVADTECWVFGETLLP